LQQLKPDHLVDQRGTAAAYEEYEKEGKKAVRLTRGSGKILSHFANRNDTTPGEISRRDAAGFRSRNLLV